MVWIGISLGYRTDLHIYRCGFVTASWYRHDFLDPFLKLHAAGVGLSFVLMNDNAHTHIAAIVEDFLEIDGIVCLELPAYSSDLNSIESLWNTLGRVVCRRFSLPAALRDLETSLYRKKDDYRTLIAS
ncbi:DDE_3 domain-containing protein [Trichonephila clavipes]|nr:DDE_3 domain-containing protein [Trichonephila clavipes]